MLVQSKDMSLMKICSSIGIVIVSIKTGDRCGVIGVIAIQVSIDRTNRAIGPSPTLEGVAKETVKTTEFVGVRDDDLEFRTGIEEVIGGATVITSLVGVVGEEFIDVENGVIIINELTNVKGSRDVTNRSRGGTLGGRLEGEGARLQVSRKGLWGEVGNPDPRCGITNERDKFMGLTVKGNGRIEWRKPLRGSKEE